MAFTFLHAADIHLDSPLHGLQRYEGAPVDAIRQSTREAFKKLVQFAIQSKVAFVVLAGDLYDGDWRDYNTGLFFVAQARRLQEAGIPLYLIAGNHDAQNTMTRTLQLPETATLLGSNSPQTLYLDDVGVAIHGQSFATRAVMEDLSRHYPAGEKGLFNIGILHTSATGKEGHEPYAPCTLDGLQTRQYQYWALGHVHQREILCEEPWVTFSGNIQGRHIRETGPKGCWLVTVHDDLTATPEFQPLDVMRWERATVDLTTITQEDDLFPAISQALQILAAQAEGLPVAVRVELTGRTLLHDFLHAKREYLVNQIRGLAIQSGLDQIWIEKVSLHTKPPRKMASHDESTDNPWDELAHYIAELRQQPEEFLALGSEVVDLQHKLPKEELDLASAGLLLNDPSTRDDLLDEIESLLQSRLMQAEGDA